MCTAPAWVLCARVVFATAGSAGWPFGLGAPFGAPLPRRPSIFNFPDAICALVNVALRRDLDHAGVLCRAEIGPGGQYTSWFWLSKTNARGRSDAAASWVAKVITL